jgi:deazaflavin-dependent oxidoreductase (nitroreductase family)
MLPTFAYRLIGRFSTSRFDRWLHPLLYRASGGRGIIGHVLGSEMLLLTTIGCRSGRPRSVVLFGFPAAGSTTAWAVIGSRGGSGRVPGWVRNLEADASAVLQVHDRVTPVRARRVDGDEYEAIFDEAASIYPGYRLYRAEARHRIPIVVLEPAATPGAASGVAAPDP